MSVLIAETDSLFSLSSLNWVL